MALETGLRWLSLAWVLTLGSVRATFFSLVLVQFKPSVVNIQSRFCLDEYNFTSSFDLC